MSTNKQTVKPDFDMSDFVDVSSEDEVENSMNDLITRMVDRIKHDSISEPNKPTSTSTKT